MILNIWHDFTTGAAGVHTGPGSTTIHVHREIKQLMVSNCNIVYVIIVSAARSLTCRDDLDSKWRLLLAENVRYYDAAVLCLHLYSSLQQCLDSGMIVHCC